MWPFDYFGIEIIDMSPFYNVILGVGLMLIGVIAMSKLPNLFMKVIIGLGLFGAGLAIATGYWVIL